LSLSLPKATEAELDDNSPNESALLDLLSAVYAISPRSTKQALARGKKLSSALAKINAYLAAKTQPIAEITSGGKGAAQLAAALDA